LGLFLKGNPSIFSCGKGRDEDYAKASAYAEFLERLQNLALLDGKIPKHNQSILIPSFPDAKKITLGKLINSEESLIKNFFTSDGLLILDNYKDMEATCYPFYNVFKEKQTYIPYNLFLLSVGSNGMCSGNTPEEALIQGICEIFERYFYLQLYLGKIECVPIIDDSILMNTIIWKHIVALRKNGYEVFAKDCSLKGRIPVTGLLVVKGNKAAFCAGAAPHFEIALERCINELFQGMDFELLEKFKMKPIVSLHESDQISSLPNDRVSNYKYNFLMALRSGSAVVPPIIFDNDNKTDKENLFQTQDCRSLETLHSLIKIIAKEGSDLYIRDVSFLGFPSFHIYIPRMSELLSLEKDRAKIFLDDLPRARESFYKISLEDTAQMYHLANTIAEMLQKPYFERETIMRNICPLVFEHEAGLSGIEPEIFLSMLWFKLNEFEKATTVYRNYIRMKLGSIDFHNPPDYANAHMALLLIFENLLNGNKIEDALKLAEGKYGEECCSDLAPLFAPKNGIREIYSIPECINCSNCAYSKSCLSKSIGIVSTKIGKKISNSFISPLPQIFGLYGFDKRFSLGSSLIKI
jgi:ribosomal protein S12 methylthiotransferase accessory factor